jgi:hypothetical protein
MFPKEEEQLYIGDLHPFALPFAAEIKLEDGIVVESLTLRPFFLVPKGILGPDLSAKEN